MKILHKKSILQKTILVILTVLVINFIVPTYSHADWGGVLIDPIVDLVCSLGDAIVNLLQVCMTGQNGENNEKYFNKYVVRDDEFFGNSAYSYMQGDNLTGRTEEQVDPDELIKGWLLDRNRYYIPVVTYSPEQIFTNNVPLLDINFIKPNDYGDLKESSAAKLRPTIAKWYVALRNLSIVGLLSILVYVGIRILISSTAADKAKYKQMFTDWLIALCLLFFLHYIMSFIITLTESITQAIDDGGDSSIVVNVVGQGKFSTNLLGLARFKTQYDDFFKRIAYLLLYIALIFYTCKFTLMYLKRMLMMAFLTLIAPLVALTYPIDKIGDGSAQAFNTWLKEYIFNALLQPFHLVIYIVLVSTAMDLAADNIIYAIVAMGFIPGAEKILRNIFSFNKAGAGTVASALTGFSVGNMMSKLGRGKGGSASKGGAEKKQEQEKPPRFEKNHDFATQLEPPREQNIKDEQNSGEDPNSQFDVKFNGTKIKNLQVGSGKIMDLSKNNNDTIMPDSNPQPQDEAPEQGKPDNASENKNEKSSRFKNWRRYHNITKAGAVEGIKNIGKGATRGIAGFAKFGTRTVFKAGVGSLAAAVAAASGGGLAGASAAFMAGANVGGRIGTPVANAAGNLITGAGHLLERSIIYAPTQAIKAESGNKKAAVADALLGGTAIGRELDIANGNTRYQDAAKRREFKEDKYNKQYLKDMMTSQNGGVVPSAREVKVKMNSLDPYIAQGLTDIKKMIKAQEVAQKYHIDDSQSAIIAAYGKENKITADVLKDEKKLKPEQARFTQELTNKGYSQANAEKITNYTFNVLKAQNDVAHELKKPAEKQPQEKPREVQQPQEKPREIKQPQEKPREVQQPQEKPPRQVKPKK